MSTHEFIERKSSLSRSVAKICRLLDPIVLLLIRLYMGNIFFISGMNKLDNYLKGEWSNTVYIFEDIYPIPGVSAEWIAPLWTGAELALPVLLVLGLASRFSAFGMLILTGLMELSMQIADPEYTTLDVNIMWALLLAVIVTRGGGLFSLDSAVCGWYRGRAKAEA